MICKSFRTVSNIVYYLATLPPLLRPYHLLPCPYPLVNQEVIIVLRRIRRHVTTRAKDITLVAVDTFNEHRELARASLCVEIKRSVAELKIYNSCSSAASGSFISGNRSNSWKLKFRKRDGGFFEGVNCLC